MGLLNALLGKQNVDVPKFLRAVAQAGGKGIVPIRYDTFTSYLRAQGSEQKAGATGMTCFLTLDGIRVRITIDRGLSSGLKSNQTYVEVANGLDLGRMSKDQVVEMLKNCISSVITDADTAYAVSWQIFRDAENEYTNDLWSRGETGKSHMTLRSPFFVKFADSGPRNLDRGIDWHDFYTYLHGLTASIGDLTYKLDVSYALAESIMKDWDLADQIT